MAKRTASKASLIERTKAAALARNTARLAELEALIRRRMTEVVEHFYDIGEALREITEHKLYAARGHRSFNAFLAAEGLMSARQAAKLIAVVRRVPREQALALGQEKAYALVAYTDATPDDDSPTSLLAEAAPIDGKPVAEASVGDIKSATRTVRAAAPRAPKSEAARARAKADAAVEKAVRAALRDAGFARAEVTVGREHVRVVLARSSAERLARGWYEVHTAAPASAHVCTSEASRWRVRSAHGARGKNQHDVLKKVVLDTFRRGGSSRGASVADGGEYEKSVFVAVPADHGLSVGEQRGPSGCAGGDRCGWCVGRC